MELMLTGDAIDGREAVRIGMANRAFPEADLERETSAMAERVASIPSDLLQINKRTVHRAMEFKGVRTATRAGSELQGLASNLESTRRLLRRPVGRGQERGAERLTAGSRRRRAGEPDRFEHRDVLGGELVVGHQGELAEITAAVGVLRDQRARLVERPEDRRTAQ